MEITQRDRDLLRQAQQKLHSEGPFVIGNIVEHQIQDPAKYKAKSRQEQGLTKDARPELPKINYKSNYLDSNQKEDELNPDQACMTGNIFPTIEEKDERITNLPISPEDVQSKAWLNMDRVEFEKLEWMSDKADKEYSERLKSTTVFDSDGKAVVVSTDSPIPEQVHDIGSLVKLLDSTFQPQITYALNVISKIAARASIGLYDAVFDENILQVLLKECLLRVRHHIDSPNETICQSALKCLRSLICNAQVDEIFLDKLWPLQSEESDITMWLNLDHEEFGIDMKDNDCIYSDAIIGLIARTDILERLKYLLRTKVDQKFRRTYCDSILDILIRFARYSREICYILNTNEFSALMIELFQPADIVRKDQLEQSFALRSLKFLRIVGQASKELRQANSSSNLKLPTSIVTTINTYYHIEARDGNDLLFRISIETLRLMKSLSSLDEFSGHIFSALTLDQGLLVNHVKSIAHLDALKPIKSSTSLDWQFAAALLDLLGNMMFHERLNTSSSLISTLWGSYIISQTKQWLNDIIRERIIPHQDISVAISVAVGLFIKSKNPREINDIHRVMLDHSNKVLEPTANTSIVYFKHLVREASYGSQLDNLLSITGHLRDPVMLPSYGFMNFNSSNQYEYKLNNVIGLHSPYILLSLYLNALQMAGSKIDHLSKYYADNVELTRYLRITSQYHKYPTNYESAVQKSALAQQEIRILANANLLLSRDYLRISSNECEVQMDTEDTTENRCECYSQLIFNTISIIGLINPELEHMVKTKDQLLERVILNKDFQFRLVKENYLSQSKDSSFRDMMFEEFNRLTHKGTVSENFAFEDDDLTALKSVYLSCEQPGRFWIFQPLIEYYAAHIQDSSDKSDKKDSLWFAKNISENRSGWPLPVDFRDIDVIGCLLRLNTYLMHNSPTYFQMAVKPNIEEYLCIIGSIFLDDDLFLDERINRALWHNFEIILTAGLRNGVTKIFSDAAHKISSLKIPLIDFFNRLVDQYEAVSYNNIVFTNFLLLFLTSKCDKTFKKKLLSDKADTCTGQIRIPLSEVWIPEEYMFKDKETDPEIKNLLKCAHFHPNATFLQCYKNYHAN